MKATSSQRAEAQNWIHGYASTGAGLVIAAVVPGSTSLALIGLEGVMAYHIGKIYDANMTLEQARDIATRIGLASVTGKLVALEALNFIPLAGWAVKAPIAFGIIQLLGGSIIEYFE